MGRDGDWTDDLLVRIPTARTSHELWISAKAPDFFAAVRRRELRLNRVNRCSYRILEVAQSGGFEQNSVSIALKRPSRQPRRSQAFGHPSFGPSEHQRANACVPSCGLLGGAFRLAPQILKWLDRQGERSHELAMHDKALEFEMLRGAQRMSELSATADAAWNSSPAKS